MMRVIFDPLTIMCILADFFREIEFHNFPPTLFLKAASIQSELVILF